jgi:hypothetical protein
MLAKEEKSSITLSYFYKCLHSTTWTHFFWCVGAAPESTGRYKYYVSFIDDFSKFTWIYLLKYKSEVFEKFREF